ncbi:MAG: leucine-rich repeat protein, partial [Clostridia bacterium]|nr:leucine-rich repeat protein [Clostridia bacterium]
GHAFHDCKKLTGTVVFPASLQNIQEYTFQNSGFTGFDFSKCVILDAVGGGYGGPFTGCDSITTLDMSACVKLKDLKGSFAADCDNLVNVILPPNLENIPGKAFAHCYALQSIVLPASMKTIADEAFHSARRNQTIKTFTVYVQSNVQFGTTYYPFRDSSAKIEFVLVGDKVNTSSFIAANTYSAITGATVVDYLDPESPWTYTTGTAITAHTIVENYCKPLALAGAHAFNGNPCVVSCEYCKLTTVKENPEHSEKATISYENGFDKLGTIIITCTNEGCTHKATEEAPALFTCLGYSAPMSGDAGIAIGFTINNEAVAEYEATGKSITIGVYAVAQQKLGENDIFDENGNATVGVINADLTSYVFDAFEIKIVGFAENQKDIKLSMGAYVTEDGKTYSYLQSDKAGELVGSYYAVTYNSVIASLEANENK